MSHRPRRVTDLTTQNSYSALPEGCLHATVNVSSTPEEGPPYSLRPSKEGGWQLWAGALVWPLFRECQGEEFLAPPRATLFWPLFRGYQRGDHCSPSTSAPLWQLTEDCATASCSEPYIGSSCCYGTQFPVSWGTSMSSVTETTNIGTVHGSLLRTLATKITGREIVPQDGYRKRTSIEVSKSLKNVQTSVTDEFYYPLKMDKVLFCYDLLVIQGESSKLSTINHY